MKECNQIPDCNDAKWWLKVPLPVPPPLLLNHSGTKLGSLFSITSAEHDNEMYQDLTFLSTPLSMPLQQSNTPLCMTLPCTKLAPSSTSNSPGTTIPNQRLPLIQKPVVS